MLVAAGSAPSYANAHRPGERSRTRDREGPTSTVTIATVEPIAVDLSGVPETLLGNLGRRATAARLGALNDPMAQQR